MSDEPTREPATRGTVEAVLAGPVRSLRSPRAPGDPPTAWRSAILKERRDGPVEVGPLGLVGDAQKELRVHGGPDRAVLVYGAAHYRHWHTVLDPHAELHRDALRAMSAALDASRVDDGAFGENIVLDGAEDATVYLGDRWRIGECVLRITEPRGPCATLARRWMRPTLIAEVTERAAAGWYNAVERAGPVRAGDSATLVERMQSEWSVARVFALLEARVASRADVLALREAPCTHDGLRARLTRRLWTPRRTR